MRPILACDPGLTTGWASISDGVLTAGQVEGVIEFMQWSQEYLIHAWPRGVMVCEDFVPRGQSVTWQPASLHIIGCLMFQAYRHGWEFRLQSPAEAKRFATNEKLKRAGWWVPGQDHARDALRHLLTYLCVHEHDAELLRAVAP